MTERDAWLSHFDKAGAIWRYRQGGSHATYELVDRHADFYFNSDIVAADPLLARQAVHALTNGIRDRLPKPETLWIASYTGRLAASLILATHASDLLGCRLAYMDVCSNDCHFAFGPDDQVLIVTDDVHSGGSLRKLIGQIQTRKACLLPFMLTLGNFSGADSIEGLGIHALFSITANGWPSHECPLCKNGSAAIKARHDWNILTHVRAGV